MNRWPSDGLVNGSYTPSADIETDDASIAEIELPGVRKDDLDIDVSGNRLTVAGERKEGQRVGKLRRRSRTVGEFHFEFNVPEDIDTEKVEASLDQGMPTVRLAKPAGSGRRRIPVS
ncbi:MAG: Hsp20/alpha crystallin family protein [Acidimicrobiales bacterium]